MNEQSGNGGPHHQIVAIRNPSASSASTSARQTICSGARSRLPDGNEASVAATGAAADLRMITALPSSEDDKGPGIAEAFDADSKQWLISASR
jgi:hypothetical protein